jgi:hypothetical protein
VGAAAACEDAGEAVEIEVPPKYASGDFTRTSCWRNRGNLDVPKERLISYPGAGRGGDDTALLGWAGWEHLQQRRRWPRSIWTASSKVVGRVSGCCRY